MRKGSALIEVLIAVSVAVVGLLALVSIGTKSVNNSGFASRQAQATAFSSQAIEKVRAAKQSMGWSVFKQTYGNGIRCGSNLSVGGCCDIGNASEFNSCVTLTFSGAVGNEIVTVVSLVSWSEAGRDTSSRPTARQETVISRY